MEECIYCKKITNKGKNTSEGSVCVDCLSLNSKNRRLKRQLTAKDKEIAELKEVNDAMTNDFLKANEMDTLKIKQLQTDLETAVKGLEKIKKSRNPNFIENQEVLYAKQTLESIKGDK